MKLQYILIISFIITSLGCFNVGNSEIPTYVFDREEILSIEEEMTLDSMYRLHEKETGNEIALITTANYGGDSTISDFAFELGNTLGVGKASRDNGLLIVFSAANREVRIETGIGTAKVLTDSIAQDIINKHMIPQLKQNQYYQGIYDGSVEIIEFLSRPENRIK
ncbi:TPM domain-containing protein [bacterium]|nr:TPM domain-containing protein [bacterium]